MSENPGDQKIQKVNCDNDEWKDIRETLRYFGNKRFTQLTVFIAISGFMFNAFFNDDSFVYKKYLAWCGIVLSALFLFMEHSSNRFWRKALERGQKIENPDSNTFNLMQEENRPSKASIRMGDYSVYAIYLGMLFSWVLTFFVCIPVKSPDSIVKNALETVEHLSSAEKYNWRLKSFDYDKINSFYNATLTDTTKQPDQKLFLVIDEKSSKILKAEISADSTGIKKNPEPVLQTDSNTKNNKPEKNHIPG